MNLRLEIFLTTRDPSGEPRWDPRSFEYGSINNSIGFRECRSVQAYGVSIRSNSSRGQDLQCMLDSGSTVSLIDQDFLNRRS